MKYSLKTPLDKDTIEILKAGDEVKISGIIYTARDAAHKRMIDMLEQGEKLPFNIEGQIVYYVGPCPAKPGKVIGSAGPTTSGRMDVYTPALIEQGLSGMIGKGLRNSEVVKSMIKHGAVYFGAIGGAGALIAKHIISQKVIAFPELGAEAIREIEVLDFPAYVVIDSYGNDLYKIGQEKYKVV